MLGLTNLTLTQNDKTAKSFKNRHTRKELYHRTSRNPYPNKGIFLLTYILVWTNSRLMELASFYKCLSDPTRLRIVNLLLKGPLCVCQIQDALQEAQVKTSKHLGYMKKRELLIVKRKANWNFYELDPSLHPIARASMQAIKVHASEDPTFAADLERLQNSQDSDCC